MHTDKKNLTTRETVLGLSVGLAGIVLVAWLESQDLKVWLFMGIVAIWLLGQIGSLVLGFFQIDPTAPEFWLKFGTGTAKRGKHG